MKNITLLLLLITTFISCSKSETEAENELETPIPEELIGTWEFKGIYNNGSTIISLLTETELRLSCLQENYCDVARYEKVPSN